MITIASALATKALMMRRQTFYPGGESSPTFERRVRDSFKTDLHQMIKQGLGWLSVDDKL
jgi:hypothetical protein